MFSKQIWGSNSVHHNKRVAIILFYIKNDNFLRQNLIKIFTKMHQITSFLIFFSGEHAPNIVAHGATCKFINLEKFGVTRQILATPP